MHDVSSTEAAKAEDWIHSPGHRVLLGAAAVLAVVLIIVAALARGSTRTVPVVGDSITFFAGNDITVALGDTYRADVHSGIGRRIDEMLPTLQSAVRRRPFALVVNLGTNDALQVQTHPDWRTGFARMIAIITPARCVVLTTISTLVHDSNVAPAVASEINDAIVAAVAAHSNLHVVDWNAAVHAAKGASLLIADRIHPSTAGDLTLAALDRAALDHDCRSN
jgi:succinate dehydrogenase hydrophobic anchor subunit